MNDTVYVLSNIGTPSAPTAEAVGPYLTEFLTDPGVITLPWLFRQILVRGIIVPRRAPRSAEKYKLVWQKEGSPLLVNAEALRAKLSAALDAPVLLGMLYNRPSLEDAFREAARLGAKKVVLVPLFPQFAEAITGGTVKKAQAVRKKIGLEAPLAVFPRFPVADYFVKAASRRVREGFSEGEYVLFSFHGLPESQVKKSTPACLRRPDCCDRPAAETGDCYRAQAFATARAMAAELGLRREDWSVSFQSRLGRAKWIGPYTDFLLRELPGRGRKKVAVVSPSFVSDCLETLEELGLEGRETFRAAGGESYRLVPCVNAEADFVHGFSEALRAFA